MLHLNTLSTLSKYVVIRRLFSMACHSIYIPVAQFSVVDLRALDMHHTISNLPLIDVKEAANICTSHADTPEVCVDDTSNAEVQAGPGGCVVTRPVGGIPARTRESGPAQRVAGRMDKR